MELRLKSKNKSKKIDIDHSILSIQYEESDIIDNLIKDYEVTLNDNTDDYFLSRFVLDEITAYSKYPELSLVTEIMKIMELPKEFLDREVNSLSTTEKIYLNFLRNIAKLNEIILFKDVFLGLDLFNQRKIKKVIDFLNTNDYLVIICSNDVDVLYNLAEYSVICSDSEIKYGTTDEIYTDVKTLIKLKLDVPTLSYITYKAKEEKNVKLFYSKDVRDIIKDIYKHV